MGSRSAFRYCVFLVMVQVIALIVCACVAPTKWFLYHDAEPSLLTEGYAQRIPADTPCDVVIIGDSTALADFVPSVIQAHSGLSACNLSEVRSIGDFAGSDEAIRAFLKRHTPPRYLIAGFTPNNFNPEHPKGESIGPIQIQFGLTYNREPWMWSLLVHNPKRVAEWVMWVEQALLRDFLDKVTLQKRKVWTYDQRVARDAVRGVWAVTKGPQTECVPPRAPYPPSPYQANRAGVAAFRKQYETAQTRVIVYATPVAACDPLLPEFKASEANLADYPLEVLPIQNFNDVNIHLAAEPAKVFSAQVGDRLAQMERQQQQKQTQGTEQ